MVHVKAQKSFITEIPIYVYHFIYNSIINRVMSDRKYDQKNLKDRLTCHTPNVHVELSTFLWLDFAAKADQNNFLLNVTIWIKIDNS